MKTEIFEIKVHYPKAGSEISQECHDMFTRVKPWHSEVMMFNDTLVIMANKADVHYIDILDTEFGIMSKKYSMRPDLVADKEPTVEAKEKKVEP